MSHGASPEQIRLGLFWRKYWRLTRGGVTALRAFSVLAEEETDTGFRDVVIAMAADLEQGARLSETMQKCPGVFSPAAVELIRSAERHGAWDEALTELTEGLLEGTFR